MVKGFVVAAVKNLLIVEDHETQRKALVELIGNGDVVSTAVGSAEECLDLLRSQHFDCMVLDLGLPEMTGFDLIKRDQERREAARDADHRLHRQGPDARGGDPAQTGHRRDHRQERALDGASARRALALFLHRVEANLPQAKQQYVSSRSPRGVQRQEGAGHRRRRTYIFAITSVLERYHMSVVYAENGRGIQMLHANPDVKRRRRWT